MKNRIFADRQEKADRFFCFCARLPSIPGGNWTQESSCCYFWNTTGSCKTWRNEESGLFYCQSFSPDCFSIMPLIPNVYVVYSEQINTHMPHKGKKRSQNWSQRNPKISEVYSMARIGQLQFKRFIFRPCDESWIGLKYRYWRYFSLG